ncbi:MAG: diguanylate cyclase [Sulfuricurvum sp.]|nr:diguanylate cyclase [Sulfuricurvum sp.]
MNPLKIKIIFILSLLILAVVSTMTAYGLMHEKKENDRRLSEAYEHVHLTYNETIKDTIHFYQARAEANFRSPGVLKAFYEGNHTALYELMKPRWEVMQHENPSLVVMQFHQANGKSLLRLHQPEMYGDKIATERPMVAYAHANTQNVSGFEEGRQGLAFRVLIPVFDQGIYIGLIEFGIATPYFTDKIRRFTGYDAFFFVNKSILGHFGEFRKSVTIGQNFGVDIPLSDESFLQHYAQLHVKLQNDVITYDHQAYEVNVLPIKEYRSRPIGAIMFVRTTDDFSVHMRHTIVASGLIALLLIFIMGLIVDRIYSFVTAKMSFQERYAQMILDSVPAPVIVTDGKSLIAASDAFLQYFHFETLEAFKHEHQCVCEYFEEGDTDEYLMPMRNDQRWTEFMLEHPHKTHKAKITIDGVCTIFEVRISVLNLNDTLRYVVIFNDISCMQQQSMSDPLTGAANRLYFSMVYSHAINVARRTGKPLTLIFIDIDHFKKVNDMYGHLVGDVVLKRIAQIVTNRIRNSDIFSRWGGEEFVLLLPDTSLDEAIGVANSLKEAIYFEEFDKAGSITCSFGVAILDESETGEDLLKRADEKLYEAKETGRNRIVF